MLPQNLGTKSLSLSVRPRYWYLLVHLTAYLLRLPSLATCKLLAMAAYGLPSLKKTYLLCSMFYFSIGLEHCQARRT